MFTQDLPKLKVLLGNGYLDIADAVEREYNFVLETLIDAFLLFPLSPHTLTRLQLGDCFRRSLQSSRQTTPYRLHTIVTECKAGTFDKASLEAKFFGHGGVRTVTALAAAAADNKQIIRLLNGLSDAEFQAFLKSIDAIEPHRDFLFIIETLERKRASRLSKRKHVPGPRPPRSRRPRHPHSVPRVLPKPLVANVQQHPPYSAQEPWLCQTDASNTNSVSNNIHPNMSSAQPLERLQMVNDSPLHNLPATSNDTAAHLRNLPLRTAEHSFSQGKSRRLSSHDSCLSFMSLREQ